LNELIFGAAVNVEQAYNFKKVIYKKQMVYSKLCTNIKKRNRYTLTYLASNGEDNFGQMLYFLKVSMAETFGENNSSDRYKIYEKRKGVCEPMNSNWSYYGKMSNIACQTVELGTVWPGGIFNGRVGR
jgi:hypothetical protein